MQRGEGGGRPPYGWVATGGGLEAFAPVPAEIVVLAKIRDRRAAGWLIQNIADELNEARIPTKTGRQWNRDAIRHALRTIRRYGIPSDIDAAIKAAHAKAEQKKAGEISNKTPSGRVSATRHRGVSDASDDDAHRVTYRHSRNGRTSAAVGKGTNPEHG